MKYAATVATSFCFVGMLVQRELARGFFECFSLSDDGCVLQLRGKVDEPIDDGVAGALAKPLNTGGVALANRCRVGASPIWFHIFPRFCGDYVRAVRLDVTWITECCDISRSGQ